MRIVSLLPSATEIIACLGLTDSIVGVTHECDYPPAVGQFPKVTRSHISSEATSQQIDSLVREQFASERSLYSLDRQMLERLRPDLIVTQTLCDVCAVAESEVNAACQILPSRPRVLNLEPTCLQDLFKDIQTVGDAANVTDHAHQVINSLRSRVQSIADRSLQLVRKNVVLLEWIDPPFCAGHWTPELIHLAGGQEMLGCAGEKSHCVKWQQVADCDPDVLIIACCGFDVPRTQRELHVLSNEPRLMNLRCVREGQVYIADGSAYFNRPGPRLIDSLELLAHVIHPESFTLPSYITPAYRWLPPE